ncbi:MAG: hypothetical protein PHN31_03515, partial [Candidatus Gracilibacteria bacterium]|nr:hypothetical protein [Candidatus Gracilibacteria bacterium]
VNSNISGTGVYQANGGYYSSSSSYAGGGGRIAIKFYSASDLSTLKNNILARGYGYSGDGTIYLMDYTSGQDYLLIKGDGTSAKNTSVGNGYSDYYFDTIEVLDGSKLYIVGTQNIAASMCITGGSPVGVVDPLINCAGTANFRYYDLGVSLKGFDSTTRKYEFLIDGPDSGGLFVSSNTGTISGDGTITTRIKLSKIGTYNFSFNLYDGNQVDSLILRNVSKSVQVKKE